jgi:hypothetical protein
MPCLGPTHFNTAFSYPLERGELSVENSWFYSIVLTFSTRRSNSRKSLIGAEYTEVSGVLTVTNPEDQVIMQSNLLGLCALSTFRWKAFSGSAWQCVENEAMSHRALTTRVYADEEPW